MAQRSRPELEHGAAALFLTLLVAAVLFLLLRLPRNLWYYYLAAWLVAVNLVAFGYYGFDKFRARAGRRRVPEVVLHFLAIVGGTVGAYLGMRVFRHKTIKGPFRLIFWFIVVLQLALIAAIAHRVWKHSRSREEAAHTVRLDSAGAGDCCLARLEHPLE
jgi:uncharacterized membrane protein YsdA (DUF1294 family)